MPTTQVRISLPKRILPISSKIEARGGFEHVSSSLEARIQSRRTMTSIAIKILTRRIIARGISHPFKNTLFGHEPSAKGIIPSSYHTAAYISKPRAQPLFSCWLPRRVVPDASRSAGTCCRSNCTVISTALVF